MKLNSLSSGPGDLLPHVGSRRVLGDGCVISSSDEKSFPLSSIIVVPSAFSSTIVGSTTLVSNSDPSMRDPTGHEFDPSRDCQLPRLRLRRTCGSFLLLKLDAKPLSVLSMDSWTLCPIFFPPESLSFEKSKLRPEILSLLESWLIPETLSLLKSWLMPEPLSLERSMLILRLSEFRIMLAGLRVEGLWCNCGSKPTSLLRKNP
mmetsp:Transcript_25794/g.41704  ORF Transcript_25794/g.41704 Transcript_25794/m.41704 type:complete len:204 (-) Transcript_25794:75-686(-)